MAGGVSANSLLRSQLQHKGKEESLIVHIPPFEYCTDNAAMIGCAAYFKSLRGEFDDLGISPLASARI